jgi:hypothetical protein
MFDAYTIFYPGSEKNHLMNVTRTYGKFRAMTEKNLKVAHELDAKVSIFLERVKRASTNLRGGGEVGVVGINRLGQTNEISRHLPVYLAQSADLIRKLLREHPGESAKAIRKTQNSIDDHVYNSIEDVQKINQDLAEYSKSIRENHQKLVELNDRYRNLTTRFRTDVGLAGGGSGNKNRLAAALELEKKRRALDSLEDYETKSLNSLDPKLKAEYEKWFRNTKYIYMYALPIVDQKLADIVKLKNRIKKSIKTWKNAEKGTVSNSANDYASYGGLTVADLIAEIEAKIEELEEIARRPGLLKN